MPIDRRFVMGDGSGRDEQRWPRRDQLVCPVCRQPARPEPPAYWKVADGPRPSWSHHDREPLCALPGKDGPRPADPVPRVPPARPATPPSEPAHRPAERANPTPLQKVRYIDQSDYRRSHLLPDDVECNIPRRPSEGEPGAWNIARGQLVEVCRATGASPIELHHTSWFSHGRDGGVISVARGRVRLRSGREVEFATTSRSAIRDHGWDGWDIAVDGQSLSGETRTYPPSPVVIGLIVAAAVHDENLGERARPGQRTVQRRDLGRDAGTAAMLRRSLPPHTPGTGGPT